MVAASAAAQQGARLELGQVGQLSSLRWVAEPAAGAADGVPVDVTFGGSRAMPQFCPSAELALYPERTLNPKRP